MEDESESAAGSNSGGNAGAEEERLSRRELSSPV
jgi:hypothetical protein